MHPSYLFGAVYNYDQRDNFEDLLDSYAYSVN